MYMRSMIINTVPIDPYTLLQLELANMSTQYEKTSVVKSVKVVASSDPADTNDHFFLTDGAQVYMSDIPVNNNPIIMDQRTPFQQVSVVFLLS